MTRSIINLSKIYFTQDSINYNFSDGTGNLKSMFEKIKNGQTSVMEITQKNPLVVYRIKNKYYEKDIYYSCNNRRLCVFKEYELYLKKNFPKYFNKNFSLSITVLIKNIKKEEEEEACSHQITYKNGIYDGKKINVRNSRYHNLYSDVCPGLNLNDLDASARTCKYCHWSPWLDFRSAAEPRASSRSAATVATAKPRRNL